MVDKIRHGSIVDCEKCKKPFRLQHNVSTGMLPVGLQCPEDDCKHINVWNELPILPKRIMGGLKNCIVLGREHIFAEAMRQENEQEEKDGEKNSGDTGPPKVKAEPIPERLPFDRLKMEIIRGMKQTQGVIKQLREAVSKVAEEFTHDCREDLEFLYDLSNWDIGLLEFFFRYPFCVIEYPCKDDLHSKFARFVLAPRFFKARYCYAVTLDVDDLPSGGMNIFVANCYSLMGGYPRSMSTLLQVPRQPELKVIGNKLIGTDLPWLWQEIPGLDTDLDHTPETPSVLLGASGEARRWLARRAVNPWSANPILKEHINNRYIYQSFFNDKESLEVWDKFVEYGRLAVFCKCNGQLRSTAMCMAYLIAGVKGVFCSNRDQMEQWKKSYTAQFKASAMQNIIFCCTDEELLDVQISCCQAIFLDASIVDEHVLKFLRRLINFRGYVMVISEDPLLDFDEDDEVASLVHASCGFVHQMSIAGTHDPSYRLPFLVNRKFKETFKLLRNQRKKESPKRKRR